MMKATVMQPQRQACHGPEVSPEVKAVPAPHYPGNQAAGELRGAFLIE